MFVKHYYICERLLQICKTLLHLYNIITVVKHYYICKTYRQIDRLTPIKKNESSIGVVLKMKMIKINELIFHKFICNMYIVYVFW